MTFFPMVTAECCRRAGWLDQAAALVVESAEIVSQNDEHYYEAELLRVQGDLAAAAGDLATAEARFRAGMALAARQKAKPFELRNAMGLAGLLAARKQAAEARRMVAKIYGWFTEGQDTEDLIAAKTLLDGADPARAPRRKRR
jgi:ATP/maltotriose-dependent transcriptional regulator MalT